MTKCASEPDPLPDGAIKDYYCTAEAVGQHVYIYKTDGADNDPLTLCEVKIYGTPVSGRLFQHCVLY